MNAGEETGGCNKYTPASAAAHVEIGALVDLARARRVQDGEPEIRDAALEVRLHEDVARLDVAVCDGRLTRRHAARDLRVQVAQAARRRVRHPQA